MAKRGYKLQEFVAHSANVNCLKIGKKTRRNFITGGDDEKVNLWSIGKPTATTSLSGHTSPIESVAFDSTEVLVAAGASSGVIKLWDLEETKVVRTLSGHRSYCTALEFHPFGEFFASGSMDTNLKIWDIRKKGCIHTYKGHRRAVSTIRFSPDGRWVVSGGLDNVVKIWDLTAGKLLHEFKFHEGHIRSMDFHPVEFLLATGSSDKTVKFWDLETFELIGSTRPETTGVRAITFHPDGRTLFCGLDSSLKVYSWEPVVCHDGLDMGWSTLGDICIDDGKLLGCSYYQNSVAVWVADTTQIEQHGHSILAEENTRVQTKFNIQQDLKEKVGSPRRSTMSTDDDTKDIKNIYVDSVTPVASRKPPTVVNLQNPKEIDNLASLKQDNIAASVKPSHRRRPSTTKLDIEGLSITGEYSLKSVLDSTTVVNFQRMNLADDTVKDSSKEEAPISTSVAKEIQKTASTLEMLSSSVLNFQRKNLAHDAVKDSSKEKVPVSTSVAKEIQKTASPGDSKEEKKSVKYVNGVAVVHGRTRSLVERFEKRDKLNIDESQTPDLPTQTSNNTDMHDATRVVQLFDEVPCAIPEAKTSPVRLKTPDVGPFEEPKAKTSHMPVRTPDVVVSKEPEVRVKTPNVVPFEETIAKTSHMPVRTPDVVASKEPEVRIKTPNVVPFEETIAKTSQMPMPVKTPDVVTPIEPEAKASTMSIKPADVNNLMPIPVTEAKTHTMLEKRPDVVSIVATEAKSPTLVRRPDSTNVVVQRPRTAPSVSPPEKGKGSPMQRSMNSRRVMPERVRPSPMLVTRRSNTTPRVMPERTKTSPMMPGSRYDTSNHMIPERNKTSPVVLVSRFNNPNRMIPEKAKSSPLQDDIPQTTGRGLTSKKDDDIADDLMLNHDVFLSSLLSRLTKLQVVRHFFEKNDTRGGINALKKLPDHAVQADVVSVLMEKMDSLTLDLFSDLLPVLLGLLDSNTERHMTVSLEILLKLVAVFGTVVNSTISAPPTVGVDLHAEKRLECCNQCHIQLLKIHKCLPDIIRRGGLPARCAQELNIILQKS